jgi:tetratricopeptide (TPR) repeat protein
MSKFESTAVLTEQASVHSKGVNDGHRTNISMMQNVLLIWLDNNIDENNTDCRNTIAQLRCTVNTINTFTDPDRCIDFLTDIYDENICMIISGALCQHLVPFIHPITQLQTIFVFCGNKSQLEQWAKHWPKVKGVFTDIAPICEALKEAAQECEQNSIPISLVTADDDVSQKKLDQLDSSFMYTQILKEILLTIEFEKKHRIEFLDYCREQFVGNSRELNNIKELEIKYENETPIWWYTCESFLYPMLNRVLRLMDVDLIIKIGFFIGDLHRQIEELHKKQFGSPSSSKNFTVYRGQGMVKTDFEKMMQTKGGLLSFNCFLSTSRDYNVSLRFANRAATNLNMVGVLFVMTIDPSQFTTPFASIVDVSYYGDKEDEVLFSMHTIFRIDDITSMDENDHLFRVELTLTSDNDKDLRRLTDRIREETFPNEEGWFRLGSVLLDMGQAEKAQQVCQTLLKKETEESAKAAIYNQLGLVKVSLGEYQEAITFYEKSLEINEKILPPNHPNLASFYNNIGWVYQNIGDYPKALSSYEKALAIKQQSLPPNHPDLASSHNNIGNVYSSIGDYSKALSSYGKTLAIQQQSLPPNHPHLASSYGNIGILYQNMGNYSKAISSYEKALEIQQQSLPPNHPDLASSYNNIGSLYGRRGEDAKALPYFEKALAIRQQSLPPNHPDLACSHNNIGNVYENMGDYPKALSSYEKALAIQQQSLPTNHHDLASLQNSLGNVYGSMGDYPKALSSYEKALAIQQQSLPPNHPDLASSHNKIGRLYGGRGEYAKALPYFEKALEILQQSLPSNHPDLATSHFNIGLSHAKMSNYSKAYSSYECAVNIGQQSLPSNHPDLRKYQKNLAEVIKKL